MELSRKEQAIENRLRNQLTNWGHASPWPGVIVCAVLTALAAWLHRQPFRPFTLEGGQHPVSGVLLALLFGIILRNLIPATKELKPGVTVVIKKLLPIGIVLLGARLDFYDLVRVGLRALLAALITILLAIVVTQLLGKLFKIRNKLSLLIGVGTAICGSSAIVATAPVVEAEENDIAFSIATINLFGVVAMLLFPVLGVMIALRPEVYGVWCGLAVHATPQVLAAAFAYNPVGHVAAVADPAQVAGEIATIVKLTRVSLLGPAVFAIGAIYAHQRRKESAYVGRPISYRKLIPTFVIFFIAMAVLRTLGFFPEVTFHMTDQFILGKGDRIVNLAKELGGIAKWIITGAMAGVGLSTEFRSMKTVGMKPFVLGLIAAAFIALIGLLQASLVA